MSEHMKLEETVKVDIALDAVSLASTSKDGAFHSFVEWARGLFTVVTGPIADGQTVIAQVRQAQDGLGLLAKDIVGALVTITGSAGAAEATITAAAVVDGDKITINGQVFTAEDTAPDASLGEYDTGANDTAAMVNLAAVVNSLLPKLVATPAAAVLTLTVREPGEETITLTAAAVTLTPATVKAIAYVEVEERFLDDSQELFTHIGLRVTTDATIVVGATLNRGHGRFNPTQFVAASKSTV